MNTFTEMPYGYRLMTEDEQNEYNEAGPRKWGWMRDEFIGELNGEPIRQWPCMVEFDLDHDHDPVECERMMSMMRQDDYDFDFTEYDYPAYDAQTDHYERFGRPAFPNEY